MQTEDWITRGEMMAIPASEVSDPTQLTPAPVVSVLMMTRNHEAYLMQAVESVLAQQCPFGIEIIIGEDHSTDGTRALCEELQAQHPDVIRLIVADRNVGITANFLRLVARARGQYVAFLEGDDYWTSPDKLRKQVALMEAHPEYAWCAARTANRTQWMPSRPSYGLDDVLRRYIVHTSTVLFRTALLENYPPFPDRVCWESMLLAFLSEQGSCGFIDQEMSYYRRHSGGLWHNAERMNRMQMSRDCIDAMNDYFRGRYREALADREGWILGMDIAPPLNAGFLAHWRQSFGVLRSAGPRLYPVARRTLLGLWAKWLVQPVAVPLAMARARLGLGQKLRGLKARIARLSGASVQPELGELQLAIVESLDRQRDVFFVQIGSNDGQQGDPLRPLLLAYPEWRGVFVEPVNFLFDKLRSLYSREKGRFAFENVAIGTKNEKAILFNIAPAARTEEGINVPHWCYQLASFRKDVLLKNLGEDLSADLGPFIQETEVQTLTLSSLFERNRVERIDLLHIDTEGYDYEILRQLDFTRYQPRVILFEHVHLNDSERHAARVLLQTHNYRLSEIGRDTLAIA